MKYNGYDSFVHRALAQIDPHAARLTRDQFDLWWRMLPDDERSRYDARLMLADTKSYMSNLYERASNVAK